MTTKGPILALFAAALFGVSPALAKLTMGEMSPVLLAGLLYLGSGLGLSLVVKIQRKSPISELVALKTSERLKLLGAIVTGGIVAPLCLAYAIKSATAFEVSALLNLETVTTTLLAWLLFHEQVGVHVWIGKIFLIVGGLILTVATNSSFGFSVPGLLAVAACFFWGLDNNLTRDVESLSPSVLAGVKGLSAGIFNILLALALGQGFASAAQIGSCLGIGALSYGLSLVLFIQALRAIGASRTSTYFAAGPFFGMLLSVLLLGERPALSQWIASFVMALGLWTLHRERHAHSHTHEQTTHQHKHVHDEHHQHSHTGEEGPEPHEHVHTHEPITHSHPHLPDIHHRHSHASEPKPEI